MAAEQLEKINFKLEYDMSAGDYTNNEIRKCTKLSPENQITYVKDIICIQTNSEIFDDESIYEESYYSDHSDKTECTSIQSYQYVSNIPVYQYKNNDTNVAVKSQSSKRCKAPSMSNICDKSESLEDKVKCLSLREAPPIKNIPLSRSSRKNMSFKNDEAMKIERDNEFLLRKIMSQTPQKIKTPIIQSKLCSSAINRKKLQKKIQEDNIVLLRRLQQAKSCFLSNKIPGYRATHL